MTSGGGCDVNVCFLPTNLFSWSLNVTVLLFLFFLGNFLKNTSAKFTGSIPDHGWVLFCFVFSFLFSSGNSVDLEVNILIHC